MTGASMRANAIRISSGGSGGAAGLGAEATRLATPLDALLPTQGTSNMHSIQHDHAVTDSTGGCKNDQRHAFTVDSRINRRRRHMLIGRELA